MSDVYRGKIRIYTIAATAGWHHATIAPGFVTLAKSYSPNWHEALYPEEALVQGVEAFAPEQPMGSPHVIIGEAITDAYELRRCKSVRFGRVACTTEREFCLMDTMDTDILAGWLGDDDDILDDVR